MNSKASDSNERLDLRVVRAGDLRSARLSSEFQGGQHYLLDDVSRDLFLKNPCGISDEDPVQVVAVLKGVIVGRINLLKGHLLHRGQRICMHWASGFGVDTDIRGKGIGKALLMRMEECGEIFGAIGVSRYSEPMFDKFGWRRCNAARFLIIKRSLPIVRRSVKAHILAVPAAAALDACIKLHRSLLSLAYPVPDRCRAHEVEQIPDCAFPDDAARVGHSALTFPRNREWLRWLISHTRDREGGWRRQYVVTDASGNCIGYFLISTAFHEVASRHGYRNLTLCTVKDWQAVDGRPESNRSIAILAAQEAMKADVDVVELSTNDRQLAAGLKRCGAVTKGGMPLYLKQRGSAVLQLDALDEDRACDFRAADGDHWFF